MNADQGTTARLTVREVFAIAANEVQACAREGDDPGDVLSNLTLVNHAATVEVDRRRRAFGEKGIS